MAMSTYTVEKGDTFNAIVEYLGVNADELAAYNMISDRNKISVGQVLRYNEPEEAPAAPAASQPQAVAIPVKVPAVPSGPGIISKIMGNRTLLILVLAGAVGLVAWKMGYLKQFSARGLRRNPARRRRKPSSKAKRWKKSSRVQSLLFPSARFTPAKARTWARRHGYKGAKADETRNFVRVRQASPAKFKKSHMRTIKFGRGIKAVVGEPVD